MTVTILTGDCREVLKTLPDESVHCVVSSPPYYGLRDYGTAQWVGGYSNCDHKQGRNGAGRADGIVDERGQRNRDGIGSMGGDCKRCGARRIDRQIGLEPTPDEYIAELMTVFREVRRVLRHDGTIWLNLGDSYCSIDKWGGGGNTGKQTVADDGSVPSWHVRQRKSAMPGLKPKDLLMIPARVALALQADGWWLRSDIIWSKSNPMPESVTDRPTSSHEHIFLLAKAERYFFDANAVREEATYGFSPKPNMFDRVGNAVSDPQRTNGRAGGGKDGAGGTRNIRNVWIIATSPYPDAHFATFPPELAERCIRAGCPEKCCAKCGAPWVRDVVVSSRPNWKGGDGQKHDGTHYRPNPGGGVGNDRRERVVGGTAPTCSCDWDYTTAAGTVLDPFGGVGTAGLVADRLGRNAILIELNPKYVAMAEARIHDDAPLLSVGAADAPDGARPCDSEGPEDAA